MSTQTDERGIDAYYLAELAAQLMCRQSTPSSAVETAWKLLEQAKDKIEGVRLRALTQSPEAQAEWEKLKADQLDNLHLSYGKGVHVITGIKNRWSGEYGALNWFKKFLQAKAEKQEKTKDGIEARVEAWLIRYRENGFTGTEAKKLQGEFNPWRNKGKQGRVKKKKNDGRLRENRQRKRLREEAERQKEAAQLWREITGDTRPKSVEAFGVDNVEVVAAAAERASCSNKTPVRGGD